MLLLSGLLGFVLLQLRQSAQRVAWAESLHLAEAGVNYYLWCLNNDIEGNCSLEKEYTDPGGNPLGKFSLDVITTESCGETTEKQIEAVGWIYQFPQVKRKVSALFSRESVAKYAYLLNDNVWAGADREIKGLYHSNGGIRMDGENQSLVSSAKEDWLCTSSFGCDYRSCPAGCTVQGNACKCSGVFTTTANANPDLFDFPTPPFDFDGITVDLAEIKSLTQPYPQQFYWPPSINLNPEGKGYHVKFLNNGTFEVWIITRLQASWAYSLEEGWHYDYFIISNEYRYGSPINIDPGCSLIFFEDNLWVEGNVKGKVTVVSANLINPNVDTSVVLPGNINYTALDGSNGFAVVGEKNVLIGPQSPNIMELRGIFIAQKGHFGRNHYSGNIKEKLEISGSIVSNGREGTKWLSGSQIVSGYLKRENYVDTNLIYAPPAFVPRVTSDFRIVSWEEVE